MKYSLFFFLFLLFAACDSIKVEPTINEMLTNRSTKKWALTKVLTNGQETEQPCNRDDTWIFSQKDDIVHRGGDLTVKTGFLKCFLGEPEQTHTWFYGGSDDRYIYVEEFVETDGELFEFIYQYEIFEITPKTLVLKQSFEAPYGDKLYNRFYYFENR